MVFSSEFRLAAACCIWPPSDRRDSAIRAAASASIDWEKFLRIVRRQHVAGLVNRGLDDAKIVAPAPVRARLGEAATSIARSNLLNAVESQRIQAAFDTAKIPIVFFKGTALGMLAYGELGLKYSSDVDILVRPRDVAQAAALLSQLGYRSDPPFPDGHGPIYRHWIRFGQEYLFIRPDTNTKVELHWRLISNDAVLTGLSPASDTQAVFVANGIELRTLPNDVLLIYLCVHGARHNWARLKWLADVNAMFARADRDELGRLFARARQCNADICVKQAIVLCDALYGASQSVAIAKMLRKKLYYRFLKRLAFYYLAAGGGETDSRYDAFGQFVMFLSRYMLGRGLRYWYSEFVMQMFTPFDLFFHPEAAGSRFYPILRVLRWLMRAGRQRLPPTLLSLPKMNK